MEDEPTNCGLWSQVGANAAKSTRCGTRTRNPQIRSLIRYPLRQPRLGNRPNPPRKHTNTTITHKHHNPSPPATLHPNQTSIRPHPTLLYPPPTLDPEPFAVCRYLWSTCVWFVTWLSVVRCWCALSPWRIVSSSSTLSARHHTSIALFHSEYST